MTVTWKIHTGFPAASYEGSFEIDDNTRAETIDEMVMEEMNNRINVSWETTK